MQPAKAFHIRLDLVEGSNRDISLGALEIDTMDKYAGKAISGNIVLLTTGDS